MREAFLTLLSRSLVYSTAIWLLVMLTPRFFAGVFTSYPEPIAFTAGAMRVFFPVSFMLGIQLACQRTFIAIGNAKASLFLAVSVTGTMFIIQSRNLLRNAYNKTL